MQVQQYANAASAGPGCERVRLCSCGLRVDLTLHNGVESKIMKHRTVVVWQVHYVCRAAACRLSTSADVILAVSKGRVRELCPHLTQLWRELSDDRKLISVSELMEGQAHRP